MSETIRTRKPGPHLHRRGTPRVALIGICIIMLMLVGMMLLYFRKIRWY